MMTTSFKSTSLIAALLFTHPAFAQTTENTSVEALVPDIVSEFTDIEDVMEIGSGPVTLTLEQLAEQNAALQAEVSQLKRDQEETRMRLDDALSILKYLVRK